MLVLQFTRHGASSLTPWIPLYLSAISLAIVAFHKLEKMSTFQQLPLYLSKEERCGKEVNKDLNMPTAESEDRPAYANAHQSSHNSLLPGFGTVPRGPEAWNAARLQGPNSREPQPSGVGKHKKPKNNDDMRRGLIRVFVGSKTSPVQGQHR